MGENELRNFSNKYDKLPRVKLPRGRLSQAWQWYPNQMAGQSVKVIADGVFDK